MISDADIQVQDIYKLKETYLKFRIHKYIKQAVSSYTFNGTSNIYHTFTLIAEVQKAFSMTWTLSYLGYFKVTCNTTFL